MAQRIEGPGAGRHPFSQAGQHPGRLMTVAEYVQQVVDEAPPLTAEQRDRLAVLLRRPQP